MITNLCVIIVSNLSVNGKGGISSVAGTSSKMLKWVRQPNHVVNLGRGPKVPQSEGTMETAP